MALIKLQKEIVNDPNLVRVLNANFNKVEIVNQNAHNSHNLYRITDPTPQSGLQGFPNEDVLVTLKIVQKSNRIYIESWNKEI